jgi:methyl-accepting chemotaxis protein
MSNTDPQMGFYVMGVLVMLVIAVLGWLLKRAIANNDAKVDRAIIKIGELALCLNKLELLMVGNYYLRQEHIEFARHLEVTLEQLRGNMHNLRDQAQTMMGRVSVVEANFNSLKERSKEERGKD